jgi:tripartite-type tricarboxylate transporter receptor subunit TctC
VVNFRLVTRVLLGVFLATLASIGVAGSAPDRYPSRPITLIVPWGPGGGADQMARALAKAMQETLQTASVPVINVPGADGNTGLVRLIGADSDGYTLAVLVTDTFYGAIKDKAASPWRLTDITPLAVMNRQPLTYFASPSSPYKTWADIVKASKSTQVKIAIDGFGSAESMLTKFLESKGVKLTAIPFAKPGERYAALLGNQVDLLCEPDGNLRRYIESGQMRPLIVFDTKRVPEMPGVPTASELGYKVTLSSWRAIVVKAGTDPQIIQFLSDALDRVYKSPDYQQFLDYTWSAKDGYVPAKDMPVFLRTMQQQMEEIGAAH